MSDDELWDHLGYLLSRIPYWVPEEQAEFDRLSAEFERRANNPANASIFVDSAGGFSSIGK